MRKTVAGPHGPPLGHLSVKNIPDVRIGRIGGRQNEWGHESPYAEQAIALVHHTDQKSTNKLISQTIWSTYSLE